MLVAKTHDKSSCGLVIGSKDPDAYIPTCFRFRESHYACCGPEPTLGGHHWPHKTRCHRFFQLTHFVSTMTSHNFKPFFPRQCIGFSPWCRQSEIRNRRFVVVFPDRPLKCSLVQTQFTGSIASAVVRSPFVVADLAPLYRLGPAACTAFTAEIRGVRVLDLFSLRQPTEIVGIVVAWIVVDVIDGVGESRCWSPKRKTNQAVDWVIGSHDHDAYIPTLLPVSGESLRLLWIGTGPCLRPVDTWIPF